MAATPPTDLPFKDLTACRMAAVVPANTVAQVVAGPAAGAVGAQGDYLQQLMVIPTTTSPGAITS